MATNHQKVGFDFLDELPDRFRRSKVKGLHVAKSLHSVATEGVNHVADFQTLGLKRLLMLLRIFQYNWNRIGRSEHDLRLGRIDMHDMQFSVGRPGKLTGSGENVIDFFFKIDGDGNSGDFLHHR